MAELTLDQQKALAMARARKRKAEAQSVTVPGVKAPDGRTTAPGTTQAEAADLPPGMVYDERTGGYVDAAVRAERLGPTQGVAATYLAGTPFIGESMDEALGKVDSLVTGRSPEIGQEIMRQSRQQFAEDNPKTAMALEMGSGVVGSLPLAASGAGFVARGGNAFTKGARASALAGSAGAVEGAAQGYGAGTTPEDRIQKAQRGAMIGAGVGATLGPTAAALGYGAQELARRFRRLDVKTISQEFGISPRAARVVQKALRNDDLDAAEAALKQAGADGMLADAGEATGALLDASMNKGGAPLRIGREAVETRAGQAGERLTRDLDRLLGPAQGRRAAQSAIAKRTAPARKEAYDRAFARPIDYASDKGRNIESVLQRVPPRTLRRAVDEANDIMREAGDTNRQIIAEIADDGGVSFKELPNTRQLDTLKQALANIAREETDAVTGKISGAGLRARRLARDLGDATKEANPLYRRATVLGGDKIAEENAYNIGVNLMKRGVTLEDVQDVMQGASVAARSQARAGLRRGIEDTLAQVKRTITDPNTDAREAMALIKDLSSRANRDKVVELLGEKNADKFLASVDRALPALELRAAVAGNSKTAIRQSIQGQIAEETTPGLLRRTVGDAGNPLDAAKQITKAITRTGDQAITESQQQIYAEIAEALVSIRGEKAQKALRIVRKAIDGQPINDAQARFIGRVAGSSVFSGIHRPALEGLAH